MRRAGHEGARPFQIGGIVPSLTVRADQAPIRREVGIGALMPWSGRLWMVTYLSNRKNAGGGTGLYEIDESFIMHTRSLLPLCREPQTDEWPEQLVCEHYGLADILPQRIVIHDRYKYVAALFDMDELYDLEDDPYETNNLVDSPEHADVRMCLRALLVEDIEARFGSEPDMQRLLLALRNEW